MFLWVLKKESADNKGYKKQIIGMKSRLRICTSFYYFFNVKNREGRQMEKNYFAMESSPIEWNDKFCVCL